MYCFTIITEIFDFSEKSYNIILTIFFLVALINLIRFIFVNVFVIAKELKINILTINKKIN